jgi:hypothetical protein
VSLGVAFNEDHGWDYPSYRESPAAVVARLRNGPLRLARMVTGEADSTRVALGRPLQADQVRLFTYASAPDAFALANSDFQAGLAFVLFVQDLTIRAPATP